MRERLMPREIVHWDVLERTRQELIACGERHASASLTQHPVAAFLGAVAHDAPYYYRFGRGDSFEVVAESLHGGNGEDPLAPLKVLANDILQEENPKIRTMLWSFLLGMVSHYATDIHFHPLVYYLTGDYYDPQPRKREIARAKHRLFEVYLDQWFRPRVSLPRATLADYRIDKLISALGNDFEVICELLERNLVPEKLSSLHSRTLTLSSGKNWRESFKLMGRLQRLFLAPSAGHVMWFVHRVTGGRFAAVDALFSYDRDKAADIYFQNPIEYRYPTSGENARRSVTELRDLAVSECVTLAELLAPVLSGAERKTEALFGSVKGKSMGLGVIGASIHDFRYASPQPVPLAGFELSPKNSSHSSPNVW